MSTDHQAAPTSAASNIVIELSQDLVQTAPDSIALHNLINSLVKQETMRLMRALGIPGEVNIRVESLVLPAESELIRVAINERTVAYSAVEDFAGQSLKHWLLQRNTSALLQPDNETLAHLMSLVVMDRVREHPGWLLEHDQATQYRLLLSQEQPFQDDAALLLDAASLMTLLQNVLSFKVSIADTALIASVLSRTQGQSHDIVAEELIAAVLPHVIQIRLPEAYFRQMTLSDQGQQGKVFQKTLQSLYKEHGVVYPGFAFVVDDTLPPLSFAFTIHHVATGPIQGLEVGNYLVRETPSDLSSRGIYSEPILDPETLSLGGVITSIDKEQLEGDDTNLIDPMAFIFMHLTALLKRHHSRFIHLSSVKYLLDQLNYAFPAAWTNAQAHVTIHELTYILRNLVKDDISIRNLLYIVERIIDYHFAQIRSAKYVVINDLIINDGSDYVDLDAPLPSLEIFIRDGLKIRPSSISLSTTENG
jgi:hypothetical protein